MPVVKQPAYQAGAAEQVAAKELRRRKSEWHAAE
jgi:hypothetical protein